MQNRKFNFIVVDDSQLDCFIAEKIIKNTGLCDNVKSFLTGADALNYITENAHEAVAPTILMVDIQMPVMDGFMFIEEFEKLPLYVTNKYLIYVISSSINFDDLRRVHSYASIRQFLNKPINSNNLSLLISKDCF